MSVRAKKIASARWFFIVIALIVLFLAWKIAQPLILTLTSAAVFAIVLTPVERKLRIWLKSARLSSALTVILAILVIIIPVFFTVLVLIDQAQGLVTYLQEHDIQAGWNIQQYEAFNLLPIPAQEWLLSVEIGKVAEAAGKWAVTNLQSRVSDIVRIALNASVFFVALYYFLHDRKRIQEEILALSPFKDSLDEKITHRIVQTVRNVVFGAVIISSIQAALAMIGLTIFGVPGSVLWGSLAIIAAQIPMVGISLIMIPAVAYLLLSGKVIAGIGLLIWAVVVVGLVDNLLSPFIVGGRTKMHSLLILISILGGLQFVGPIGFIVGPTVLAALLVVIDLYKSGILETK